MLKRSRESFSSCGTVDDGTFAVTDCCAMLPQDPTEMNLTGGHASLPTAMDYDTDVNAAAANDEENNVLKVVRTFECLPSSGQNSALSRLMDKCTKKQLSFIANIIMPRLKVDIARHVPREIALQILSHLPVDSLCQLAQTCQHHRDLVNDGHLWRGLLVKYRFVSASAMSSIGQNNDGADLRNCLPSLDYLKSHCSFPGTSFINVGTAADVNGCPSPPHYHSSVTSMSSSTDSLLRIQNTFGESSSALSLSAASHLSPKDTFRQAYMLRMNWSKGRCKHYSIRGPNSAIVTCLQFTSDIFIIATDNSTFGLIEVYDSVSGRRLSKLSGHEGGVWAIECWDDLLVSGGCDRDLRVWDWKSGQCKYRLRGHTSTIRCLQMVDKKTVVTGSRDNSVRIWDIETGLCKKVFEGHTASVRCLVVHGNLVVTGSYDCSLRVWDIKRERLVHVLQQHVAQIYSVAFNGKYICSGSLDADIRVWEASTGKCLWTLEGHDALVGHMQLKANTLVTGGSDGRVCVWNVETGEMVHRIQAHFNSVTTLEFDHERIVSGGDDGIKIWNFETGAHIRTKCEGVSGVWRLQFDKNRLVAATQRDEDSFIEIMDFSPTQAISVESTFEVIERSDEELGDDEDGDDTGDDELLSNDGDPIPSPHETQ